MLFLRTKEAKSLAIFSKTRILNVTKRSQKNYEKRGVLVAIKRKKKRKKRKKIKGNETRGEE